MQMLPCRCTASCNQAITTLTGFLTYSKMLSRPWSHPNLNTYERFQLLSGDDHTEEFGSCPLNSPQPIGFVLAHAHIENYKGCFSQADPLCAWSQAQPSIQLCFLVIQVHWNRLKLGPQSHNINEVLIHSALITCN